MTPVAEDIAAFAAARPGVGRAARGPRQPRDRRRRTARRVVEGVAEGAHPLVLNFLRVLADRGRLDEFPAIADAFAERVSRAENRIDVEAVTAVPLPADLRERIVEQIRRRPAPRCD